jgi:hypothetical protein
VDAGRLAYVTRSEIRVAQPRVTLVAIWFDTNIGAGQSWIVADDTVIPATYSTFVGNQPRGAYASMYTVGETESFFEAWELPGYDASAWTTCTPVASADLPTSGATPDVTLADDLSGTNTNAIFYRRAFVPPVLAGKYISTGTLFHGPATTPARASMNSTDLFDDPAIWPTGILPTGILTPGVENVFGMVPSNILSPLAMVVAGTEVWILVDTTYTIYRLHFDGSVAGPPILNTGILTNPTIMCAVGSEIWILNATNAFRGLTTTTMARKHLDGTDVVFPAQTVPDPRHSGSAVGMCVQGGNVWLGASNGVVTIVNTSLAVVTTYVFFTFDNTMNTLASVQGDVWEGWQHSGSISDIVRVPPSLPPGPPGFQVTMTFNQYVMRIVAVSGTETWFLGDPFDGCRIVRCTGTFGTLVGPAIVPPIGFYPIDMILVGSEVWVLAMDAGSLAAVILRFATSGTFIAINLLAAANCSPEFRILVNYAARPTITNGAPSGSCASVGNCTYSLVGSLDAHGAPVLAVTVTTSSWNSVIRDDLGHLIALDQSGTNFTAFPPNPGPSTRVYTAYLEAYSDSGAGETDQNPTNTVTLVWT